MNRFALRMAALLLIVIAGCGMNAPRAFEQQARADILMRFNSWTDFQLVRPTVLIDKPVKVIRPDGTYQIEVRPAPATRETFVEDLGAYPGRRNLAVIVFDMRLAGNPAKREAEMADLENLFKHFGFQHVVFQQDMEVPTPEGLPILREY